MVFKGWGHLHNLSILSFANLSASTKIVWLDAHLLMLTTKDLGSVFSSLLKANMFLCCSIQTMHEKLYFHSTLFSSEKTYTPPAENNRRRRSINKWTLSFFPHKLLSPAFAQIQLCKYTLWKINVTFWMQLITFSQYTIGCICHNESLKEGNAEGVAWKPAMIFLAEHWDNVRANLINSILVPCRCKSVTESNTM